MGSLDGGAWGVGTGFVGEYFLVGEEPELEAAEGGGEVGEDPVGVAEVVDPHLGAEGHAIFLQECGRVVWVWWGPPERGEGGERLLLLVVVVQGNGGGKWA